MPPETERQEPQGVCRHCHKRPSEGKDFWDMCEDCFPEAEDMFVNLRAHAENEPVAEQGIFAILMRGNPYDIPIVKTYTEFQLGRMLPKLLVREDQIRRWQGYHNVAQARIDQFWAELKDWWLTKEEITQVLVLPAAEGNGQ